VHCVPKKKSVPSKERLYLKGLCKEGKEMNAVREGDSYDRKKLGPQGPHVSQKLVRFVFYRE
jgi:hypothetical protein